MLYGVMALYPILLISHLIMYYLVHCFWLALVVVCTTSFLFVKCFFGACMAINVVSVQYNYGQASPRHYTVDPMLLPLGNPLKCQEDYCSMIPPTKRFEIFPPVWDAQKVQMNSDFSLNDVCQDGWKVTRQISAWIDPKPGGMRGAASISRKTISVL